MVSIMSTDVGDILFVAQIEVHSDYLRSLDCSGAIMYCAAWSDGTEAAKERLAELLAQEDIQIVAFNSIDNWDGYRSGANFKDESAWDKMLEATVACPRGVVRI